jgi:hypothetical protein
LLPPDWCLALCSRPIVEELVAGAQLPGGHHRGRRAFQEGEEGARGCRCVPRTRLEPSTEWITFYSRQGGASSESGGQHGGATCGQPPIRFFPAPPPPLKPTPPLHLLRSVVGLRPAAASFSQESPPPPPLPPRPPPPLDRGGGV